MEADYYSVSAEDFSRLKAVGLIRLDPYDGVEEIDWSAELPEELQSVEVTVTSSLRTARRETLADSHADFN